MRIIYGTKVLTEEDLFDTCGRPGNTIDFVNLDAESIMNDLSEVSLRYHKKSSYQSNEFLFLFIPVEIVEEYILFKTIGKSVDIAKDYMVTQKSIDKSDHISKAAEEKIEYFIDYYSGNTDFIRNSACVTFVLDPILNKRIRDVCVSVPRKIIDKAEAPMDYVCSECGITERTDILPDDMMYTIANNKIKYICNKCSISMGVNSSHVGDVFHG